MNAKQLLVLGGGLALVAKFYNKLDWKGAMILGGAAAVLAAVSDNIVPANS